jgi:hypothetical protein
MLELFAFISMLATMIGILTYFYFHEKEQQVYISKIQHNLTNLPIELQKFYAEISSKDTSRNQKLINETFRQYLRHIEKLERMVLPKPVTEKDVQSVMNRIGTIADNKEEIQWENEIEKAEKGVELPKDDWTGYINADTKVAFEGEEDITVIE